MPFRDHVSYQSLKADLQAVTNASDAEMNAVSTKLTWVQILTLVWQFGSQYGPQLFAVITSIIAMLQAPGGVTLAAVEQLLALYGPSVLAMITTIAGWLGVTLPTLPGVPTPPAGTIFKAAPFAVAH